MFWHLTWRGHVEGVSNWLTWLIKGPPRTRERCVMGSPISNHPYIWCSRRAVDGGLWCRRHAKD